LALLAADEANPAPAHHKPIAQKQTLLQAQAIVPNGVTTHQTNYEKGTHSTHAAAAPLLNATQQAYAKYVVALAEFQLTVSGDPVFLDPVMYGWPAFGKA
jgi:hypothetical protein